jgi:hypothetical protein
MAHRSLEELESGLAHVDAAPADKGTVELVVRRPAVDAREILDAGELDPERGLVGDGWLARGSRRTPDGRARLATQLTLTSARVMRLVAGDDPARWALAGDQLYVDLDLGAANLPPGTRLAVGSAVIEITDDPHHGCAKYAKRFGQDAVRFLSAKEHEARQLRGVHARILRGGVVRRGDAIAKVPPDDGVR